MARKPAKPKDPTKLTDQQRLFCHEYLIDLNASQAMMRAGYSAENARANCTRLMEVVGVKNEIARLLDIRSKSLSYDAAGVLQRLIDEHRADIADLYDANGCLRPVRDWPMIWRTGISVEVHSEELYEGTGKERKFVGYTRKVKFGDRLKRLELIGKHVSVAAFRDTQVLTPGALDEEMRQRLYGEVKNRGTTPVEKPSERMQ